MIDNESTIIMNQEELFDKYQDKISKENKFFTKSFAEEFTLKNAPKCTIKKEKELESLENQFNKLLSKYQILKNKSIANLGLNINVYNSNNPYKNKNVKFKDNVIGYVTNGNVFKEYVDGKKTVPGNFINIDIPYKDSAVGKTINTNPPLIVGTPMKIGGQSVGHEGKNVFVNTIENIPSTYVGCYNDKQTRTMERVGDSRNYNYKTCKNAALDAGSQYFGLQYVDSSNGLAQCYISNDFKKTTQYGENVIYKTSNIWEITPQPQSSNIHMVLQNNGDIYFYDQNNNLLDDKLSNSKHKNKITQKGKDYLNNCLNGGYISNVKATYGLNCATSAAPSRGVRKPPGFAHVVYNNVGSVITDAIGSNTRKYIYQIGVDNKGKFKDPAPGCWKNFDLSYNCGSKLIQIPTINGRNPGTDRKHVILNCEKYQPECSSYIILQNDGNLCIRIGSGPDDSRGGIYYAMTNGTERVANPNFVASKGKTGLNWLASGTGLMSGEWIGSNDGSMYLIMTSDGSLQLNITTSITNSCSVSQSDGKTTGGTWSNAVYKLDDNIPDPSLFYKLGYVDNDSKLFEYPSNMIGKGISYIKYDNYDSSPYNISGGVSGSFSKCKKSCDSNPDCNSFVINKNNKQCYLKSSESYPKGLRQPNTNMTLYVKNPVIIPEYSNTYTSYFGQDSIGFDNVGNPITGSTQSSCENTCNSSPLCAGYVYDNGSCWIKYKIPLSNISKANNQTKNVYVRNIKETSFNINEIKNITSQTWENYMNDGKEMTYKKNTNIGDKLIPEKQEKMLNEMEVQLYLLATQITNKIQYFESNNIKINEQLKKSIDKFKRNTEKIKYIKIETNKYTNTNTTNSMLTDSDLKLLKSNYSYIGFSILAIVVVIITMNKIK